MLIFAKLVKCKKKEKCIKNASKMCQKMCDRFSNFLEFDKKQNEYANIVEECEEISMWNLHKDMSFAAKRKHSERKIEGQFLIACIGV